MPVTIRTTTNPPREWKRKPAESAENLLSSACEEHTKINQIIQSSFQNISAESKICSSSNGLVHAAFRAYSQHHHLTLRPEDIWFAILSQLSFYINAHAEELRTMFVAHEGKKKVEVRAVGDIRSVDFGRLAVAMTSEMEKHILDEGLRQWVLPDFTTTEPTDTVTAAVLMMGTLQKYFSYKMSLICGIPSVTLLGDREDWVKIRNRLDRIESWGEEPKLFVSRLKVVLDHLILSFDEPMGKQTLEFWSKIACHVGGGSGPRYLSGWITAFCLWDHGGKTIQAAYSDGICEIQNTTFSPVDTTEVPGGYVSVPVTVDDNGKGYRTTMVAGSIGEKASSSGEFLDEASYPRRDEDGETKVGTKKGLDTIQPVSGWWMYEPKAE